MTRREQYVLAAAVFTLWAGITTAAWIALSR